MPASRRGITAYARIDQQLADWLTANGRPCQPSRVAGWRAAGLLPTATGHGVRAGRSPGRVPGSWTDDELADARAIGWRLIDATGRGKSAVAAALTLAGEGLPVPATTVLAAAREHMARLDRYIRLCLGLPAASELDHRADPKAVAEAVDEHVLAHPGTERAIARRLRHVPLMALAECPQGCSSKVPTRVRGQVSGRRVPVVARRRLSVRAWWSRSR